MPMMDPTPPPMEMDPTPPPPEDMDDIKSDVIMPMPMPMPMPMLPIIGMPVMRLVPPGPAVLGLPTLSWLAPSCRPLNRFKAALDSS